MRSSPGTGRMPVGEVCREAWRDVVSGASWAVTWAVVCGVLLTGLVGIRTAGLTGDVRSAAAYVASGAATTVQRAEGRIDGRACDALGTSEGVVASGALRRIEVGTVVASLPGSAVPTYEVTPGMLGVLGVGASTGRPGVVVSPSVRETLGASPGEELVLVGNRTVPVSGAFVYPDDGRDPDLEYSLLAQAIDDGRPYDACWVTVWPQRDDTVPMLRRTVLGSTGAEDEARPTVGQLNARPGAVFTPSGALPLAVPLGAAAVLGFAVGGAAVLRRRLALAADLHVGVPRSAQVLGVVVQHAVWAGTAVLVPVSVATVMTSGLSPADAVPIVLGAREIAVVAFIATLVGGATATGCVRERALHRYFRTR